MDLLYFLIVIIFGIVAVTCIDTLGSIISRVLNYNYSNLTVLSFTVYILLGYLTAVKAGLLLSVISPVIVGIYDATVGWAISKKLRANWGKYEQQANEMTAGMRIKMVIGVGIVFGFIGYLMENSEHI